MAKYILLCLAALISGCSGGIETKPVEDKIVTLRLVDSLGNAIDKISSASPGRLIALLKDATGKPVMNEMIRFTTTLGTIAPEAGTAITNINGEARIDLIAGSKTGAGQAKAAFGDYAASLNFTIEKVSINISLKLVKSDGEGAGEETRQISGSSPGCLVAALTYGTNNAPIVNQEVQFSTTLGYIQPTSGLALTDAKGKATVNLLSGLTPGEGEATVTFGDYKISLKFAVVREDISVSLTLISRQSWLAYPNEPNKWEKLNSIRQANSPACLVAALRYVSGNPVSGKTVQFKTTLGGILPIVGDTVPNGDKAPKEGTALTDKNGHAAVYLFAGSQAGAGQAVASFEDYPPASVGFTTIGDQSIFLSLKLQNAEGREITNISKDIPGRLIATLTYSSENTPLPNERVTFTTTLGLIQPKTGTALTDNKGEAVAELLPGSLPGAGEVTATFGTYSAKAEFQTQGDSPVYLSLKLIDEQTGKPINALKTDATARLEATLEDAQGNPLPDSRIEFEPSEKLVTIQPNPVLTDKDGKASVTLFAGSAAGKETISAKFQTISESISFEVSAPRLSLQMTDTEGNPASDTMPINSSRNIVAILTDSGETPMPNQTIKFSATLGTLQASSDMTNEKGEAKVSFSSGSVADKGKITADFGKSSTEMEFTVTGSAINISLQVLDKDAAPVTQLKVGDTGRLEAKLTDAENAPLVSKLVTFSLDQDIAEISPETKTALTDSDGKASVSLTASKTGAGKATASYENYSATTVLEVNAEAATARQHQTSFKTEIYPDFSTPSDKSPGYKLKPDESG